MNEWDKNEEAVTTDKTKLPLMNMPDAIVKIEGGKPSEYGWINPKEKIKETGSGIKPLIAIVVMFALILGFFFIDVPFLSDELEEEIEESIEQEKGSKIKVTGKVQYTDSEINTCLEKYWKSFGDDYMNRELFMSMAINIADGRDVSNEFSKSEKAAEQLVSFLQECVGLNVEVI